MLAVVDLWLTLKVPDCCMCMHVGISCDVCTRIDVQMFTCMEYEIVYETMCVTMLEAAVIIRE